MATVYDLSTGRQARPRPTFSFPTHRRKVAIRSFIEAGWSTYAEQIIFPSNRAAAAASSLQTVHDLAAKMTVGLRFNCKNLARK
jgi:hypothetical protein